MDTLAENSNHPHLEAQPSPPPTLQRDLHAIRRILVCLDRSPFSEACLGHAFAISKSLGSAITLLHVIQSDERPGAHATDVLDWEIARQEASTYLARLEKEAEASGRHVDTRLEEGYPAERIVAVARELDVDLTVLGSHGERGVAARNLGSTTLQFLAMARGSVLVARQGLAVTCRVSPKRILVPLDGSVRTESALPTVVRIARANDAEVLLVLVVREPVPTAVLCAREDIEAARDLATHLEASGKRYLDRLRDQLTHDGVSARAIVLRSADQKQSLLELSKRERSDLIVLSAHGSTCSSTLTFGSVATHLLTHSLISLLVLQDLHDFECCGPEEDRQAPPLRASYPPDGS
jgi:nucleotide-binding universal stress UspA family protein